MLVKKEPKAVPAKALNFLFSIGLETQVDNLGKNKKFIQDIAYYKALGEYALLSEKRSKALFAVMDSAVAEFAPSESLLTDTDPGEIIFKFFSTRITNSKKDARELELTDDKGRNIGFAFSKDLQVVIRPNILEADQPADFGIDLLGKHCSEDYIEQIRTIAEPVYSNIGKPWKSVFPDPDEKFRLIYVPMLQCFSKELQRLCEAPGAAKSLVKAFFGNKDYYHVSLSEKAQIVKINGYLPYREGGLVFPTKLLTADLKEGVGGELSDTTLCCEFDKGWILNLRLHPTNTKIQPSSLRFEADFKGSRPEGVRRMTYSW